MADFKINAFPGGEMIIRRSVKCVLLNLVAPKTNVEPYKIAIYQKGDTASAGRLKVSHLTSNDTLKLGAILGDSRSRREVVYIKSNKSVVDLLEKGKVETKRGEEKKPCTSRIPTISSSATVWKGNSVGYQLDVEISTAGSENLVLGALLCANDSIVSFRPSVSTSSTLSLSVNAADADDLVEEIGEALRKVWESARALDNAQIEKAVRNFYDDPYACVSTLIEGRQWPTSESIASNKKKYVDALSRWTSSWQPLNIRYNLKTPPVPLELVYHTQVRVETALYSSSLDLLCSITKTGDPDKLYDKLLQFLPDGTVEGKDVLKFTYGALLDIGQRFTYGECDAMFKRLLITHL
jgi:hypothetical protein